MKKQDLNKNKLKKPVLEQFRSVWLNKQAHFSLRRLKKEGKGTMAQIVCDLIIREDK